MELDGRVALVTGGGRRVGRALVLALARAGADVVINYHTSGDAAAETAAQVEALGRRAVTIRADVSRIADVRRLVEETASAYGRLDVLVNSASLFESEPFLEIDPAAWDRVMAVNLKGPFLLTQTAAAMLGDDGGGVVINIADLSGLRPWPRYGHHSVSKAGLIHLTKLTARALAPHVRANCIVPGTVLPPEEYGEEEIERSRDRTVLGRIGSPEDVARALLYLVESDFTTGAVVVVDGGRMLR